MSDAATIINEAAARRERVEFPASGLRVRDPFREIRVVELEVLPCPQYPKGTTLMVHPKQVLAHKKLYPGSRVLREIIRPGGRRRLNPTDVKARGHGYGTESFLPEGRTLVPGG